MRTRVAPGQLVLPFPSPHRQIQSYSKPLTGDERSELNGWRPPTMPKTRAECRELGLGWRVPCPHMHCRYHLGIEVSGKRVVVPHGDLPLDEYPATCWEAVVEHDAEMGRSRTDGEVARLTGLSLRTVERTIAEAMAKLRANPRVLRELTGRGGDDT